LIDKAVRVLIPPGSREAVVGDLWERYASPLQYAAEALRILPFLIASQIPRNANIPQLGIAAFTLFVSFGGFQVAGDPIDAPRWLRAAVHAIATLLGSLLRDAYRASAQQRARRRLFRCRNGGRLRGPMRSGAGGIERGQGLEPGLASRLPAAPRGNRDARSRDAVRSAHGGRLPFAMCEP
jgi:hypothetical protein